MAVQIDEPGRHYLACRIDGAADMFRSPHTFFEHADTAIYHRHGPGTSRGSRSVNDRSAFDQQVGGAHDACPPRPSGRVAGQPVAR